MSDDVLRAIAEMPIVGIVRTRSGRHSAEAVGCAAECGLTTVEVTTSDPKWESVIRAVVRAHPELCVGAGTILTVEQARAAAAAGARYLVAPNVDPVVGAEAERLGLGWLPGAATPTEIVAAWRTGATAVKVFPASSLGGPDYLRQVRAPLSDIPLLPTGGIDLGAIPAYLDAGAVAVGLGSPLFGDSVETGLLDGVRERASRAVREASRRA